MLLKASNPQRSWAPARLVLGHALCLLALPAAAGGQETAGADGQPAPSSLPAAPSAVVASPQSGTGSSGSAAATQSAPDPCAASAADRTPGVQPSVDDDLFPAPCMRDIDPYQRFLNSTVPIPLSPRQKGILALRDISDPFNLLTVAGNSAVFVAGNAHSAYGPGMRGLGRNFGYSLLQDGTGEFVGTFAVCSLFGEDPHYHREPYRGTLHRFLHAVGRSFVAQHDDGRLMPNWNTLLTYPVTAEISNLYVPGIGDNASATGQRILLGYATDPIGNLIAEFLPDVARRVHIRVLIVQRIINQVARSDD